MYKAGTAALMAVVVTTVYRLGMKAANGGVLGNRCSKSVLAK